MKRNNTSQNLDERVENVHLYIEAKKRLKGADEKIGFIPEKQAMADLGISKADLDGIENVGIEVSRLRSPHPGIILLEDYLKPKGISQSKFAQLINVSPNKIYAICNGKRGINAEMALRLAQALGTSAEVWLGLQMDYDLDMAKDNLLIMDQNRIGSNFDDFLREEGILNEVEQNAAHRVEKMKQADLVNKKQNTDQSQEENNEAVH